MEYIVKSIGIKMEKKYKVEVKYGKENLKKCINKLIELNCDTSQLERQRDPEMTQKK